MYIYVNTLYHPKKFDLLEQDTTLGNITKWHQASRLIARQCVRGPIRIYQRYLKGLDSVLAILTWFRNLSAVGHMKFIQTRRHSIRHMLIQLRRKSRHSTIRGVFVTEVGSFSSTCICYKI